MIEMHYIFTREVPVSNPNQDAGYPVAFHSSSQQILILDLMLVDQCIIV